MRDALKKAIKMSGMGTDGKYPCVVVAGTSKNKKTLLVTEVHAIYYTQRQGVERLMCREYNQT